VKSHMLCTLKEFLIGVQNKLCVTWDWCKTKMFGRDTGGELHKCMHLPPRNLQRLPVLLPVLLSFTHALTCWKKLTVFRCAVQMCIDWFHA